MKLNKPGRETDLEVKQYLDTISPSFCAAKWYNATIWLGSGMSTSCHHPPAHYVPIQNILSDRYKGIHNTPEKKADRHYMQQGVRPAGCEYCWKIEDMGRDAISDRVYKSVLYTEEDIAQAAVLPPSADVDLRTLEIAFDRTCNFACSYCNPSFSSTWVRDIKRNGPYTNLISDGRGHFTHTHEAAQKFKLSERNPYIEAFFKWWEADLHRTLDELRITGGEPLMSDHFWRLLDWFKENKGKSTTKLAINSNLGYSTAVEKLIDAIQDMEPIELYTSCEATYSQAEYIRRGLVWAEWVDNLNAIFHRGNVNEVHVMCTINALCLESLPEFLTFLLGYKAKYKVNFTLNILRFPSFQSPLVLPDEARKDHMNRLKDWMTKHHDSELISEMERNHVYRLIDYLDVVKTPHAEAFELDKLRHDFKSFYIQYDERSDTDFRATFPRLADWYDTL